MMTCLYKKMKHKSLTEQTLNLTFLTFPTNLVPSLTREIQEKVMFVIRINGTPKHQAKSSSSPLDFLKGLSTRGATTIIPNLTSTTLSQQGENEEEDCHKDQTAKDENSKIYQRDKKVRRTIIIC